MKPFRLLILALALSASLSAQLIYTSDNAGIAPYTAMKADLTFVNNTLLNLGSINGGPDNDGTITSFSFGALTFNAIPNLDPNSPSDLQVGPGFTADVVFLGKDSIDGNTFGAEQTLLGLGSLGLYPNYGAGSTLTWHITANSVTDLVFWHQDASSGGAIYAMDDVFHFTTFAASDLNFQYYIFGIDDRGTSLQDFDDGVFGVRLNLNPAAFEPVPEPSTYALFGAAVLLGLVALRRIRQTKN